MSVILDDVRGQICFGVTIYEVDRENVDVDVSKWTVYLLFVYFCNDWL